jgi:type I restriction enzyme, S subunit
MKTELTQLGEICSFVSGDSLPDSSRKLGSVPVYGSNGIIGLHNTSVTND